MAFLLICMGHHMCLEIALLATAVATVWTLECLGPLVHGPLVTFQVAIRRETFVTRGAPEGSLPAMCPGVASHVWLVISGVAALGAAVPLTQGRPLLLLPGTRRALQTSAALEPLLALHGALARCLGPGPHVRQVLSQEVVSQLHLAVPANVAGGTQEHAVDVHEETVRTVRRLEYQNIEIIEMFKFIALKHTRFMSGF